MASRYGAVLFGIFFSLLVTAAEVQSEPEVRGLWVVRDSLTSPENVRRLVIYADSLRCNVLFVQVRGRGDAFYLSRLAPGPEDYFQIPEAFDPLAMIIELAHESRIEVHAWLNMYLAWSAQKPPSSAAHVLNCHPDWFMTDLDGRNMAVCHVDSLMSGGIEGRYLSPALAEVREHLTQVVEEMVLKYPVDGVHLDYVRYPGWKYDFGEIILQGFRERFGIDPRRVLSEVRGADPNLIFLEKWTEYRAEAVTGLVRDISSRVRRIDPNVRISAAVKSDVVEASVQFGQDWTDWLKTGIVDFVLT